MMNIIKNGGSPTPLESQQEYPENPAGKRGRPPRRAKLWRPRDDSGAIYLPSDVPTVLHASSSLSHGGVQRSLEPQQPGYFVPTGTTPVEECVLLRFAGDGAVVQDKTDCSNLEWRLLWPEDEVLSTPYTPDVHLHHSRLLTKLFEKTGMPDRVASMKKVCLLAHLKPRLPVSHGVAAEEDLVASNLLCMLKDRHEPDANAYDDAMHDEEDDEDDSDEDESDAHSEQLRAGVGCKKKNDDESVAAVLMSLAATPPLPQHAAGKASKDAGKALAAQLLTCKARDSKAGDSYGAPALQRVTKPAAKKQHTKKKTAKAQQATQPQPHHQVSSMSLQQERTRSYQHTQLPVLSNHVPLAAPHQAAPHVAPHVAPQVSPQGALLQTAVAERSPSLEKCSATRGAAAQAELQLQLSVMQSTYLQATTQTVRTAAITAAQPCALAHGLADTTTTKVLHASAVRSQPASAALPSTPHTATSHTSPPKAEKKIVPMAPATMAMAAATMAGQEGGRTRRANKSPIDTRCSTDKQSSSPASKTKAGGGNASGEPLGKRKRKLGGRGAE